MLNGYQRISAALRGELPDRTPVMLHNFMMAAREAAVSMRQFRTEPAALARSFIQAVEKYGYDGVMLDVDTVTLAGALGLPLDLPEDLPARSAGRRLDSLDDVGGLEPVDLSGVERVQVWLEAASLMKRQFGDEVYLRGNCDQCPFSLAAALRGLDGWLIDIMDPDNEERIHQLLEYCLQAHKQFLRLMAATGVHMLSGGDSPAGPDLISPRLYRRFALPYEQRVAAYAHELGLPYALHICGKTNLILDDMIATGADALELDYKTDVHLACTRMKDRATFIGNIDPSGVLALGTAALVAQTTRCLLDVFTGNPRFILNAGCAIPAGTPPQNLMAMIASAQAS